MKFTVSIYDLISWGITIISLVLFWEERKKNSRLPYYMAIQGILRACKQKAGFYGSQKSQIEKRSKDNPVTKEEYLFFAETVYSDFASLMEHIMGSLKAIEPKDEMPFDTMEFTSSRKKTLPEVNSNE
jgi:hypothetical protein